MAHLPGGLDGQAVQERMAQLQAQIRAQPQKAELRLALCHFLALRGEWTRAQEQARQARKLDPALTPPAATCEMALRGEEQREAVWEGREAPAPLADTHPEWAKALIRALALDASEPGEAAALRADALEAAPALAGTITLASKQGTADEDLEPTETLPVLWVSDGDARLGPMLELFTAAGYGWLPMQALRRLSFRPPRYLVDLLWAPVEMTLCDGTTGSALMPVRYPDVAMGVDDALLLGRRTDWAALAGEDQYAGRGQRVLITDAGDLSLLDLRAIEWAPLGADDATGGQP